MRHSWHTHVVCARDINANTKTVSRRNLDNAKCLAEGFKVPSKEHQETVKVVSLDPGDLDKIFYGRLDDDGFLENDSHAVVVFRR